MIKIKKSPNADSRTAKENLTIDTLRESTKSHISDVSRGMEWLSELIIDRGQSHDHTKLSHMEEFHQALTGGNITMSDWYKFHVTEERHHLKRHVPDDVNIIDVIEHIVDCSMAGLARSGEIYDTDIDPNVLTRAIENTVKMIISNIKVVDPEIDIGEEPIDEG